MVFFNNRENQVWELLQQSGKDEFNAKKHGIKYVLIMNILVIDL